MAALLISGRKEIFEGEEKNSCAPCSQLQLYTIVQASLSKFYKNKLNINLFSTNLKFCKSVTVKMILDGLLPSALGFDGNTSLEEIIGMPTSPMRDDDENEVLEVLESSGEISDDYSKVASRKRKDSPKESDGYLKFDSRTPHW